MQLDIVQGQDPGALLGETELELSAVVLEGCAVYLLAAVRNPFAVGEIVELEWRDRRVLSEVESCLPQGDRFVIGLHLPISTVQPYSFSLS